MNKIIKYEELSQLLKQLYTQHIVLVGGCFDLLHQGHKDFLSAAKKTGDILLIALESDKNIKRAKGNDRPINRQLKRARNLIKLKSVDLILLLPDLKTDQDYEKMIKMIHPKIIAVTENDPRIVNKKRQAEMVGAKVIPVVPYLKEYSTTKILKSLRSN